MSSDNFLRNGEAESSATFFSRSKKGVNEFKADKAASVKYTEALVDTPQGQRALTTTEDAGLVARLQQEEFVGRRVRVDQNTLTV